MSVFQVHSNHRHTQHVRVFNEVVCEFKASLLSPWAKPAFSLQVPLSDLHDPSSRIISLPLGGRPAQILRCHFSFSDRWLLISEISFYSSMNTRLTSHSKVLWLISITVLQPLYKYIVAIPYISDLIHSCLIWVQKKSEKKECFVGFFPVLQFDGSAGWVFIRELCKNPC